jgi:hypothetical protein
MRPLKIQETAERAKRPAADISNADENSESHEILRTQSTESSTNFNPGRPAPELRPTISRRLEDVVGNIGIGVFAAQIGSDMEFRRNAVQIHAHGERVTVEALAHLIALSSNPIEALHASKRFADLSSENIEAAGADQMPPEPLYLVKP